MYRQSLYIDLVFNRVGGKNIELNNIYKSILNILVNRGRKLSEYFFFINIISWESFIVFRRFIVFNCFIYCDIKINVCIKKIIISNLFLSFGSGYFDVFL